MTMLATEFKRLRLERGLSQRAIASLLHCDHTYISKIENDGADYPPSEKFLVDAATVLDVEPDFLIFAAGRIPSRYSGLLSRLALVHGDRLPALLNQLLEVSNG